MSSAGSSAGVVNDSGHCWTILILIRRDLYKDIHVAFATLNLAGHSGGARKTPQKYLDNRIYTK